MAGIAYWSQDLNTYSSNPSWTHTGHKHKLYCHHGLWRAPSANTGPYDWITATISKAVLDFSLQLFWQVVTMITVLDKYWSTSSLWWMAMRWEGNWTQYTYLGLSVLTAFTLQESTENKLLPLFSLHREREWTEISRLSIHEKKLDCQHQIELEQLICRPLSDEMSYSYILLQVPFLKSTVPLVVNSRLNSSSPDTLQISWGP